MSKYATDADGASVGFTDSPALDAFGRQRMSLPQLRFSVQFDTSKRPDFWDEVTVGTGSATHLPNERSVRMRVAASGDSVTRQTFEYFSYRSGQSHLILCTGVLSQSANVTSEIGYFDDQNGLFFRATGTTVSVVRRTFTSGAAVDVAFDQADWNIDKMLGGGPSGITVDWTKTQIFVIDFQWLGVGRIRYGLDLDGVVYPVHEVDNANVQSTVYMSTPKLPVRYYIEATGDPGGNVDLLQICSAVIREGNGDSPSISHSARSLPAAAGDITVGTAWETVLGIRTQAANVRTTIWPLLCAIQNNTNGAGEFAIVKNPSDTSAAVWVTPSDDDAAVQISRSNITITVDATTGEPNPGHVYPMGGFIEAAKGGFSPSLPAPTQSIPIAAKIDGTRDELWVVARAYAVTIDVKAMLQWIEER